MFPVKRKSAHSRLPVRIRRRDSLAAPSARFTRRQQRTPEHSHKRVPLALVQSVEFSCDPLPRLSGRGHRFLKFVPAQCA